MHSCTKNLSEIIMQSKVMGVGNFVHPPSPEETLKTLAGIGLSVCSYTKLLKVLDHQKIFN